MKKNEHAVGVLFKTLQRLTLEPIYEVTTYVHMFNPDKGWAYDLLVSASIMITVKRSRQVNSRRQVAEALEVVVNHLLLSKPYMQGKVRVAPIRKLNDYLIMQKVKADFVFTFSDEGLYEVPR